MHNFLFFFIFKAHQHKAAGRNTRLDVQNSFIVILINPVIAVVAATVMLLLLMLLL